MSLWCYINSQVYYLRLSGTLVLHIAYGVLYVFTVNLSAIWFKHHSIKANRNITSWYPTVYQVPSGSNIVVVIRGVSPNLFRYK